MRVLLFLPVVMCMDIVSYRASLTPLPPDTRHPPPAMCTGLLPLCGNGVIDRKNYSYQVTLPGNKISGAGSFDPVNITVAIDEVCDDGNNLDGDGCSSDCMDLDSWVSSCELHVDEKHTYEDVLFDDNGTLYFSAADGIYEMHPTLSHMASVLIAPKLFAATNMYIQDGVFWLWSPSTAAVWKAKRGSVTKTYDTGLNSTNHKGIFVQHTSGLLLCCHDEHSVVVLNLNTLNATRHNVSVTLAQDSRILWLSPSFVILVTSGQRVVVPVQGQAQVTNPPPTTAKNIFDEAVLKMSTTAEVKFDLYPIDIVLDPPNPEMLIQPQTHSNGIKYTTPWAAGSSLASLYCICNWQTKGRATGLGNTLALQGVWGFTDCSKQCMLDIPISSDMLQRVTSKGRTYYDELRDLLNGTDVDRPYNAKVTATLQAFEALVRSSTPKKRFSIHPHTQSMFTWQGNSLYELSKTGTGVEFYDGTCLVSGIAPCDKCMWASAGTKCQPCSVRVNTWAWTVQCQGCSMGRRLLEDGMSKVSFTLQAPLANVSAIWPEAVAKGGFVDVTLSCSNAPATLRSVKATLEQSGFFVATQPRVVYRPPPVVISNATAPEDETWIWTTVAVGTIAVITTVIIIFGLIL